MLRYARRLVIFIVGMTVLLIGIVMIVLPGPALIVIPIGLAILATEYAWARHWLRVMRNSAEKGAEKLNIRSPFLRYIFRNQNQPGRDNPPTP
jgi:tellurite resistance protein TerC